MWISRHHFDLIREAATTFRAYHDEQMRDKDAVIRSQEARLAALEMERRELTEKLVSFNPYAQRQEIPVMGTISQTQELIPDWQEYLRQEIDAQEAPKEAT